MRILLTPVLSLGLLFLPGPLGAQVVEDVDMPEAPEPGEVQINTATLPPVGSLTDSPTAGTILGQFNAPGVQEVEVRDLVLTPAQANNAFLSTASTTNLLMQVGAALPNDTKVDFRGTMDGQEFRARVQRNEEGELRARLEGFTLMAGDPGAFAQQFATAGGFARVRFRRLDAAGNQIRVEFRDGVAEVREDRSGRGHHGTSGTINSSETDRGRDHSIRGRDRKEMERERHADRADRDGRDRSGRSERLDRHERSGRH